MGDISPPKPRRKVRKTPVTDREKCIDVVLRDGLFSLPSDAKNASPVAYGLNKLTVDVYNRSADLMIAKASLKEEIAVVEADADEDDAVLTLLKEALIFFNQEIRDARELGHKLRKHVLKVEDTPGINEPLNWARD